MSAITLTENIYIETLHSFLAPAVLWLEYCKWWSCLNQRKFNPVVEVGVFRAPVSDKKSLRKTFMFSYIFRPEALKPSNKSETLIPPFWDLFHLEANDVSHVNQMEWNPLEYKIYKRHCPLLKKFCEEYFVTNETHLPWEMVDHHWKIARRSF